MTKCIIGAQREERSLKVQWQRGALHELGAQRVEIKAVKLERLSPEELEMEGVNSMDEILGAPATWWDFALIQQHAAARAVPLLAKGHILSVASLPRIRSDRVADEECELQGAKLQFHKGNINVLPEDSKVGEFEKVRSPCPFIPRTSRLKRFCL